MSPPCRHFHHSSPPLDHDPAFSRVELLSEATLNINGGKSARTSPAGQPFSLITFNNGRGDRSGGKVDFVANIQTSFARLNEERTIYDTFSPISKNLVGIFKRFPRWCSAAVISGNSRDGEIVRGIRERIETRGFNEACNERVEHGPRNPFFVGAAR